ncbi:hypothetical protein [Streptomyces sp. NPDC014894]|uniref:hypothetical protein n=1 Tax=unclassified Streptomyces TaxID=2593676 RepID=UPI0036F885E8
MSPTAQAFAPLFRTAEDPVLDAGSAPGISGPASAGTGFRGLFDGLCTGDRPGRGRLRPAGGRHAEDDWPWKARGRRSRVEVSWSEQDKGAEDDWPWKACGKAAGDDWPWLSHGEGASEDKADWPW